MQKIYAIILAGGQGKRIGGDIPKQFLQLNKKPVIVYTIEKFNIPEIEGIIIVTPEEYIDYTKNLIKEYSLQKIINVINGGETRQGSSYNAVKSMNFNEDDILVLHDAARPFVNNKIISQCIEETKIHNATGVYIKAIDTIAEIQNGFVNSIPNREKLYYTQTPQSFKYKIILKAHEFALSKGITNSSDDIQMVINAGYKVKIVSGDYSNIKITSPIDFELAGFIAKTRQ